MEQSESTVVLLTPFAPLIQLWAGICLLFFYETLFKRSPLSGLVYKLKILHEEFRLLYIDFIPKEELMDDNEFASDKWDEYTLPTIKNIAALTFFYCVFILVYIGTENSYGINREYVYALQPINIAVFVYILSASIFFKCKLFHTYWTPVCAIALLILYFHIFRPVNDFFIESNLSFGDFWSISQINVATLITLFSGLALVALRLASIGVSLALKKRSVNKLDSNCRDLMAVRVRVKKLKDLPKPLLKKIQPELNLRYTEEIINTSETLLECMKKEITDEYRALNTSWSQDLSSLLSNTLREKMNSIFETLTDSKTEE